MRRARRFFFSGSDCRRCIPDRRAVLRMSTAGCAVRPCFGLQVVPVSHSVRFDGKDHCRRAELIAGTFHSG